MFFVNFFFDSHHLCFAVIIPLFYCCHSEKSLWAHSFVTNIISSKRACKRSIWPMTNRSYKTNSILLNRKTTTRKMTPQILSEQAVLATAAAKRLYPASMIGTLGEAYFRTRKEMACPKGVVSKHKELCLIGILGLKINILHFSYAGSRILGSNCYNTNINTNDFDCQGIISRHSLHITSGLASFYRVSVILGINPCTMYFIPRFRWLCGKRREITGKNSMPYLHLYLKYCSCIGLCKSNQFFLGYEEKCIGIQANGIARSTSLWVDFCRSCRSL